MTPHLLSFPAPTHPSARDAALPRCAPHHPSREQRRRNPKFAPRRPPCQLYVSLTPFTFFPLDTSTDLPHRPQLPSSAYTSSCTARRPQLIRIGVLNKGRSLSLNHLETWTHPAKLTELSSRMAAR